MARSTGANARALRIDRGNDDARACFLMDHEIGAHCEHAGLQHHAQHLGNGAEATTEIARLLLTAHILPIGLAPSRGDMAGHSHGNQRLSVAPARFREAIACDSSLGCRPWRARA